MEQRYETLRKHKEVDKRTCCRKHERSTNYSYRHKQPYHGRHLNKRPGRTSPLKKFSKQNQTESLAKSNEVHRQTRPSKKKSKKPIMLTDEDLTLLCGDYKNLEESLQLQLIKYIHGIATSDLERFDRLMGIQSLKAILEVPCFEISDDDDDGKESNSVPKESVVLEKPCLEIQDEVEKESNNIPEESVVIDLTLEED